MLPRKSNLVIVVEEELCNAEQNFIDSIQTLQQFFQVPFEIYCNKGQDYSKCSAEVIKLLSERNLVHNLFFELQAHLELANDSLLLLQSGQLLLKNYFLSFQKYIVLMATYEANLENSRNALAVLREEQPISGFFSACEIIASAYSRYDRLEDYIIQPSQRLQLYKNILIKFMNSVTVYSNDYLVLKEAMDVVNELTFELNEYKSRSSQIHRIQDIQEDYHVTDIESGPRSLKDGNLRKACGDGQ